LVIGRSAGAMMSRPFHFAELRPVIAIASIMASTTP
jgi:hypothetical protein